MTTVGFIGSGQIGSTVARLAIEAGHRVVLSNSRGPETLADTAAELGPRASAATSWEAAAAGDIVVVTVPVHAFPHLPTAALAGKTVIDTCNYGPERDGHILELDSESLTSSELLLRYLPDAMLVKAFNNIFYKHLLSLARPAGAVDRSYLPIAGDSAPAKAAATEFIESIAYSVVDAGPLADSWRQATGTPVWGTPYGPYSDEKGQPAGEDAIRAALATAKREPQVGSPRYDPAVLWPRPVGVGRGAITPNSLPSGSARMCQDVPCRAVLADRTSVSTVAPKSVTRRASAVRSRVRKSIPPEALMRFRFIRPGNMAQASSSQLQPVASELVSALREAAAAERGGRRSGERP